MPDYLARAAHYLWAADITANPDSRKNYLEIASRYERLAAIERGLLPQDLSADQTTERQP